MNRHGSEYDRSLQAGTVDSGRILRVVVEDVVEHLVQRICKDRRSLNRQIVADRIVAGLIEPVEVNNSDNFRGICRLRSRISCYPSNYSNTLVAESRSGQGCFLPGLRDSNFAAASYLV